MLVGHLQPLQHLDDHVTAAEVRAYTQRTPRNTIAQSPIPGRCAWGWCARRRRAVAPFHADTGAPVGPLILRVRLAPANLILRLVYLSLASVFVQIKSL